MATAEERMQILQMIRDGKISAEEGTRLLQALQAAAKRPVTPEGRDPRWLRIKVTDLRSGSVKFNVNLPIGLVKVGLKMGARFGTGSVSFDNEQVLEAMRSGVVGKVADIENSGENERVEIWLE